MLSISSAPAPIVRPAPQSASLAASVPAPAPQASPSAPAPSKAVSASTTGVKADGVGSLWVGHLPKLLRGPAIGAEAFAINTWNRLFSRRGANTSAIDASNVTDPTQRATLAWQAIQQNMSVPGQPGMYGDTPNKRSQPGAVWAHGQGIGAALDLAQLTGNYQNVNQTMSALSAYASKGAYAPGPGGGNRYYDDNAWVGLDLMQAYSQTGNQQYLQQAQSLFTFIQSGLSPQGGELWVENTSTPTRNTCSNGPAMEMALRLYMATKDPKYLQFAQNCNNFLNATLRSPSGLYYDNIDKQGNVSKAIYSYNQGTPIGADVLFYRITGDKSYLDQATQTAKATLAYYQQHGGFFKAAPCFNAIFFRNLMALDQVAPDPSYRQALNQYLDQVWTQARDPQTGLFDKGGIGAYGPTPGNYLDQSALAQLFALQAWPSNKLLDVA